MKHPIVGMGVIGHITLLTVSVAGCCKHGQPGRVMFANSSHAVFNPSSSPVAVSDFDRMDWPVAYSAESSREETYYRERIIDVYGRGFGHDDGFLHRRFESDRYGRSRR